MIFDGGDVEFSTTNLDDIGKAVASSLLKAGDVKNRSVYVHTAVVSQNQLLAFAKQSAPDGDYPVLHLDSAELEKQAWTKWDAGERGPDVVRGFLPRATFGHQLGKFEKTDNDLLGIKQWNDDEIKDFVASYVK